MNRFRGPQSRYGLYYFHLYCGQPGSNCVKMCCYQELELYKNKKIEKSTLKVLLWRPVRSVCQPLWYLLSFAWISYPGLFWILSNRSRQSFVVGISKWSVAYPSWRHLSTTHELTSFLATSCVNFIEIFRIAFSSLSVGLVLIIASWASSPQLALIACRLFENRLVGARINNDWFLK